MTSRRSPGSFRGCRAGRGGGVPGRAVVAAAVLLGFWAPAAVRAQQAVGGQVVDAASARPLAGAQVVVMGTQSGALTTADGRFRIEGVSGNDVRLQVVMLGYRTAEQDARVGDLAIRIALSQAALTLNELVVTGTPGAQQVRSLGNSVGKVRADQLVAEAPPPNLESLLGGQVAGVQVARSRGEIGAGSNIRIRGVSSMSLSSEPLIYIDGVRVNNNNADFGGAAGVGTDARTPPSRLNDIDPEDIQSIEIIKGPSAATLYGTEASNGVINIITKKGHAGKPTFHFQARQGANWLPNPEELFGPVYYKGADGQAVAVNVLTHDRTVGFPVTQYGYCPAPYSQAGDVCKGSVFSTGLPRGYGANLSGGGEQVNYYFSFDWDRNEGVVSYNWKNQLNGRGTLNWVPTDKLTLDFGIGAVRSTLRTASAQQPITTSIIWACPAPGCAPGSGLPNALDGAFRGYIGYLPEVEQNDIFGYQNLDRTTYSFTATHKPVGWLTHRLTVGGDFTDTQNSELYKRIAGIGSNYPQGRKQVVSNRVSYASVDYSATATFDLARNLNSATSAGAQYYRKASGYIFGQGDVFPVSQLETVTAGGTKTAAEDYLENKTFGTYAQEQLAWKDRLFLTAAVRGDDNSAFGKNFKFVVYPKFSASWVVSDEPFLRGRSFLNALKLRAAWGKAGQQPDVFAALRTYAPQVGVGDQPALTPQNLGNADLKPEVGQELEAGLDASLFQDRLGLSFTYYNKLTTNAIVPVPALPSLGFPGTQYKNIGEVRNRGFESSIKGAAYHGRNVGLDLDLTLSHNTNDVLDIGGGAPFVMNATFGQFHLPGYPLSSIFFKRIVSADLTQVNGRNVATNLMCESGPLEPNSNLSRGGGPPVPCAQAPAVYYGSPLPTWTGGFSATLTLLRNLELYGLVEGDAGSEWIDGDVAGKHSFFVDSKAAVERTDPILLGYGQLGYSLGPQGAAKGGFARLRRLSATYTLPDVITSRVGASRAALTLSMENLAVLWRAQSSIFGAKIIDPEARNSAPSGNDPGGMLAYNQEGWPMFRSFLATLRVTF